MGVKMGVKEGVKEEVKMGVKEGVKMKKLMKWLMAGLLLLLCSCEKEIPIDYHSTEPLYVAEVELTPDWVAARVTTTRDVKQSSAAGTYVDNATVTIRMAGSDWLDTLPGKGRGKYWLDYFAYEGKEYEVDVVIDGRHHTSTSTLYSKPQLLSFDFKWQDVMTERMLFADLHLQDNPDENNYYFMHLYRNDIGYRWAVSDDRASPGGELQQLFSCTTEREMDKGTDSDVLRDGDRMRMELRSIDRRAYDYLYSLQLMDNTGTNPIPNFTGALLGYFSAYQEETVSCVFHKDSVRSPARGVK